MIHTSSKGANRGPSQGGEWRSSFNSPLSSNPIKGKLQMINRNSEKNSRQFLIYHWSMHTILLCDLSYLFCETLFESLLMFRTLEDRMLLVFGIHWTHQQTRFHHLPHHFEHSVAIERLEYRRNSYYINIKK